MILSNYQRDAKSRRIATLLSACKLMSNRTDIMALWGVSCLDDMTDDQIVECADFMEAAYRGKTTPAPEDVRRLRSQVLAHLSELGKCAKPSEWREVNAYLLQKEICGKLLYMLSAEELRLLIRKLRSIEYKKKRAAKKAAALRKKPAVPVCVVVEGRDTGIVN